MKTVVSRKGKSYTLLDHFKIQTVKMIALNGITDCNDLSSTQEEADTRIVLHALNADKLYRENKKKGRIVVKSPDTTFSCL